MKNKSFIIVLGSIFLLCGCGSGVKYVKHMTEVEKTSSRDSDKLKVVERAVEVAKEISEESLDISSLTKITNFEGKIELSNLSISPDGQRIVFQAFLRGDKTDQKSAFSIWTVNALNGKELRYIIPNSDVNSITPCWGTDGEYIIFASNRREITKLWRVRSSRLGGYTQLTFGNATDYEPSISPDGKKIVYTSLLQNVDTPHIWMVNMDGTEPTEMCEGYSPQWSPDGKKILFVTRSIKEKREYSHLWIMNTDGSYPTQILSIEGDCLSPKWSPNGRLIAFSSDLKVKEEKGRSIYPDNHNIWMINADGTDLTQLITNVSYDSDPCWSLDGKYIYFCSNRGLSWDIWRLTLPENKVKAEIEKPEKAVEKAPIEIKIEEKSPVKSYMKSPQKLIAVSGSGVVKLVWLPAKENIDKIAGYYIYRTTHSKQGYEKISALIKENRFLDEKVENNMQYFYVVTAVEKDSLKESDFSQEVEALPKSQKNN